MKLHRMLISMSVLVSVAGCGGWAPDWPNTPQDPIAVQAKPVIEQSRVLVTERCPSSGLGREEFISASAIIAGVGSAVIPAVIDEALGLIQTWMTERAQSFSATYSARGAGEFYTIEHQSGEVEPLPGCITVVRGEFGSKGESKGDDILTKGKLESIGLSSLPSMYLEANIDYSGEGTFRLKPVVLYFKEAAAERSRPCGQQRNGCKTINIAFTFEGPAKDENDPPVLGLTALSFEDVEVGTYYDEKTLRNSIGLSSKDDSKEGMTTSWVSLPASPTPELISQLKDLSDEDGRRAGAFTVLATVNETEDDDDFLTFVAGVLGEKQSDIGKAISDPIVEAIKDALGE